MRTTVGPLPPAVYWRRRAVVLGALLLVVILLFVSCSGGGDNKDSNGGRGASSSQSTIPAPASSTPEEEPSFSDAQPGGGPQEIYIGQGARKYWSSDTCSTVRSSDVRVFAPGAEREYSVTWNGRQSSTCQGGVAAGPAPVPGQYEVRGRLGTKVSDAVILTIIA